MNVSERYARRRRLLLVIFFVTGMDRGQGTGDGEQGMRAWALAQDWIGSNKCAYVPG